ncbi:MAG: hypothetical protein DLM60_09215 [Pseudonocardiales bacterium]|nr:MAG: hypothetical protein DLM60_09215 [Pseudonocardiales bacterium]
MLVGAPKLITISRLKVVNQVGVDLPGWLRLEIGAQLRCDTSWGRPHLYRSIRPGHYLRHSYRASQPHVHAE